MLSDPTDNPFYEQEGFCEYNMKHRGDFVIPLKNPFFRLKNLFIQAQIYIADELLFRPNSPAS